MHSSDRSREDIRRFVAQAARQDQFLEVVSGEEARARFHRHLDLSPRGEERVPLAASLGRVLSADVVAEVDVPGFDRSVVDGFAVRAADTVGAAEDRPVALRLNDEVLAAGHAPELTVEPGTATVIATGGMLPRGADAVVMVETTEAVERPDGLFVTLTRPATPGAFVAAAGSDIGRGEVVLRKGQALTSREIGVLAAIGLAEVPVVRRPRVAILSTGDEIVAPGQPIRTGAVYDSNGAILAAAVSELGGEPVPLGIAPDEDAALERLVAQGLECDALLLSGGTSKGAGDRSHRIVAQLSDPGIVAHGVALKPGKPLCLAVTGGKPVVILPGFPTSAMFTFHSFVAPVIRALAGLPPALAEEVPATLPVRLGSERGRTEYVMVSLVHGAGGGANEDELVAYPLSKGSGAVTAFSHADGFLAIDAQAEAMEAGTPVSVQLLGRALAPADLIVVGSQCIGLNAVLGRLIGEGMSVKALNVGSMGGLAAARRGECDIAPVHLMDPATGAYNTPFLGPGLDLVTGYRRMQGIVFRRGDPRFEGRTAQEAAAAVAGLADCILINRNAGSGTRILTDRLLGTARPTGYWTQAKSHNAVAVAVAQNRADWGVAIETAANLYGLGFLPLQEEHYDFVIPTARRDRPAVRRFVEALETPEVAEALRAMGFIR
ncbi:molybdopterin biosynthesis protein [Azospirillum oryzae]|uniref:Molybdopterin molybdenumtransferase n=1 Tax=Azospirillum oryzae TaxID=286727 RepID=A0A6N1AHS1_9PROT|nr:molybdopterin biosynthesis protein [Azospirillum oryzae]KAA0589483.1 molybdopterin biosynthesis protein [Azospirillum oryzae]QKS51325.1 molybdopterin biosynthesis protein [Azospirillum oryzae]GLR83225.1 molybdopterin biosynthesis protein [Azospirillum oryzae]